MLLVAADSIKQLSIGSFNDLTEGARSIKERAPRQIGLLRKASNLSLSEAPVNPHQNWEAFKKANFEQLVCRLHININAIYA